MDEGARRTVHITEPGHVGAVWRRAVDPAYGAVDQARARRTSRLAVGAGFVLIPLLGAIGFGVAMIGLSAAISVDEPENLRDRQERAGWAVDRPPGALAIGSDCPVPDVPPGALDTLASDLRAPPAWDTWSRTDLLDAPRIRPPAGSPIRPLAEVIRPLCTTDLRVAHARGRSFAELLAGLPSDTAVVVDLPGPEAVGFAAALERYAPVWTFETWPHPNGAVPAHLTLGAILYYRTTFLDNSARRPSDAPPVFVLDSNRRPTTSFPEHDNGYAVDLPALTEFRRVLYVRGRGSDGASSDLQKVFGELHWNERIPVHLVALQDFQPIQVPELPADPGGMTWWWGGSPETHWAFRTAYGLPDAGHPSTPPPTVGIPWVPLRPQRGY